MRLLQWLRLCRERFGRCPPLQLTEAAFRPVVLLTVTRQGLWDVAVMGGANWCRTFEAGTPAWARYHAFRALSPDARARVLDALRTGRGQR
ncbi:hypothetical protein [Deinococcus multiflagellatus]|uniref:Uncharacterized protein n=1 Tax=Deinococcus multiflagellatus TaxID=1656887 RepID=A0ABW1ZRU1_9DEIO|nr:hypothetical protein [Deinococcus multiflagellatus]MBZ9715344.1 hypothetical protein [Deinococcus multiflagellatus]